MSSLRREDEEEISSRLTFQLLQKFCHLHRFRVRFSDEGSSIFVLHQSIGVAVGRTNDERSGLSTTNSEGGGRRQSSSPIRRYRDSDLLLSQHRGQILSVPFVVGWNRTSETWVGGTRSAERETTAETEDRARQDEKLTFDENRTTEVDEFGKLES